MKEAEPTFRLNDRRFLAGVALAFGLGFVISAAIFSSHSMLKQPDAQLVPANQMYRPYKAPIEEVESRAQAGDLKSQVALSYIYSDPGLYLDTVKSEKWRKSYVKEVMKRAAAGDADCQYRLFEHMGSGDEFFLKDDSASLKWLQASAKGGSLAARMTMAAGYWNGTMSIEENRQAALRIYEDISKTYDLDWAQKAYGERFSLRAQRILISRLQQIDSLVEAYAWASVCSHLHNVSVLKLRNVDDEEKPSIGEVLRDIRMHLTIEQVTAAQKRSHEILAEIEANKAKK